MADAEAQLRAALAAKDDGRYLSVYNAFFATNLTAETLAPTLAAGGLDAGALEKKAASAEIRKHISDNHKLANSVGLTGTPTFFVGDVAVEGWDPDALNAAIENAKKKPGAV